MESTCFERPSRDGRYHGVFPLLSLPVELLQLVLGMLGRNDYEALLKSSKVMAQQVLQHSSARLLLQVELRACKSWAATRHLLLWATSACTGLRVWCSDSPTNCPAEDKISLHKAAAETLGSLSSICLPPGSSPPLQQQFICLNRLCLQGLILPWFVPPGLPDTCPNVHTLELVCCRITGASNKGDSCNDNKGGGKDPSSGTCSDMAAFPTANQIRHFKLCGMHWPERILKQLKSSLPSVTSLDVDDLQLVKVWAPQLTELYVWGLAGRQLPGCDAVTQQLQQLRKLVARDFRVQSSDDLRALLALPQLMHLEIESIINIKQDLSSHACTWKHVELHLRDSPLHLIGLARVPLHSLASPLVLKCEDDNNGPLPLEVWLPGVQAHGLARVRYMCQQLLQCGVKVLATRVIYAADPVQNPQFDAADEQCAALLSELGPVCGAIQHVTLKDSFKPLEQVILSIGMAHQHHLRRLALSSCEGELDTQAVWDALLTWLPGLVEIVLYKPKNALAGLGLVKVACRKLVHAMARQAVGRHIELQFYGFGPKALRGLAEDGLIADEQATAKGVMFTTQYPVGATSASMVATATRIPAPAGSRAQVCRQRRGAAKAGNMHQP